MQAESETSFANISPQSRQISKKYVKYETLAWGILIHEKTSSKISCFSPFDVNQNQGHGLLLIKASDKLICFSRNISSLGRKGRTCLPTH